MPIERFPSAQYGYDRPSEGEYSLSEIRSAVDLVCSQRGLVQSNKGEDDQSNEYYLNYSVGSSDTDADAVFLIGWDMSKNHSLDAHGMERPHTLNAPQEIIVAIKVEIEKAREAKKFSTAPSQT